MISEAELNKLYPKGLSWNLWEELKSCNLPWNQLAVALRKNIIPPEVAEDYKKMALAAKDKKVVIILGPTGTGKTVFGIRYLVRSLYNGIRPPLYLSNYELRAILEGRLAIELDYNDTLQNYITRLRHPYAIEKENYVALEEVPATYGVIMVDDFGKPDFEAVWMLIERTYSTGSTLILTSNIRPVEITGSENLEGWPERVRSRLREIGLVWVRPGKDLRGGEE